MIEIINTWILIKKNMRDSVKNVPYVKKKYTYCVAKILYCVLKGIMIMNNK